MADPLYQIKNIAKKEFFTDIQARKDEYKCALDVYYDESFHNSEKRITTYTRLLNQDFSDYPTETLLAWDGIFIIECYNEREKDLLDTILEEVLKMSDKEKTDVYITYLLSNLSQIIKKVEGLKLEEELIGYQHKVIDRLKNSIKHIREVYILTPNTTPNQNIKIQWVGKLNLLATLFYDLLNGQEKVEGKIKTKTKPLIFIESKDALMDFLINNFVDIKNQPLKRGSLDDYLNKSKPETRSKQGIRIELPEK